MRTEASVTAASIDALALDALRLELMTTPKPGLVDAANAGAHSDMDFDTFSHSILALKGYFGDCFTIGMEGQGQARAPVLSALQTRGCEAEQAMYRETGGVNTHKGAIFSLGILAGACGRLYGRAPLREGLIRAEAADLCRGLTRAAFADAAKKPPGLRTKGEKMYLEYGMTGARGEAESGYATIANISLPLYTRLLSQGISGNAARCETLLHLIAYTEDTNIASRHDRETAAYARRAAQRCIACGGYLQEGGEERLLTLDAEFIKRRISPGGSADLLAATHFLVMAEHLSEYALEEER